MRFLTIVIGFLIYSCNSSISHQPVKAKPKLNPNWMNTAFLITDGVYNTELTAPFDIFHHTKFRKGITPMNVFTVSNKDTPVLTFEGLRIIPDYNLLTDSLPHIDILVIPSAEHHLDQDLENKDLIDWIKKTSDSATYVTSHCDGAFMLAETGILDRKDCTTFPADIPLLRQKYPNLNVIDSVLFVHHDKYITSAGGAKSFEAALYLCEILYGKEVAMQLAKGLVIDWDLSQIRYYKNKS